MHNRGAQERKYKSSTLKECIVQFSLLCLAGVQWSDHTDRDESPPGREETPSLLHAIVHMRPAATTATISPLP